MIIQPENITFDWRRHVLPHGLVDCLGRTFRFSILGWGSVSITECTDRSGTPPAELIHEWFRVARGDFNG